MHPAWSIEDVRDLLFEHLEARELARLARTSQTFFRLATDRLWTTINSFDPLLCCLPSDFGDRPLQVEDIERLDFYTSKVRHLKLEPDRPNATIRVPQQFSGSKKKIPKNRSKKSWRELWEEIAEVRPASKLFCNLCYLRVNRVVEELLIPLVGISGLHLTKIYIKTVEARQEESVIWRILDGFHSTPNLEYLFVRNGQTGIVPRKLVQQAPLKHIRFEGQVYIPALSSRRGETPILYDVLQKSTLENLTISLAGNWCNAEILALKGKHLPALKTLWITVPDFTPSGCRSCGYGRYLSDDCDCFPDFLETANPPRHHWPSPVAFFEGLDNPELRLLNIKFSDTAKGPMLLEIAAAAIRNCKLQNLVHLALAGSDGGYWADSRPIITPTELRMAVKMFLPMPRLKLLRVSVAPNFLDILDLKLYRSIAEEMPALETLWLGHSQFVRHPEHTSSIFYEDVSLEHLAAFCQMLPNLAEVSVGASLMGGPQEIIPNLEFACPKIKSVRIGCTGFSQEKLGLLLGAYFPSAKEAKKREEPAAVDAMQVMADLTV